jgi:hypothetical protein
MRPATSASLSPVLPRPNCPRNGHLKGIVCPGARWVIPLARKYTWRSPDASGGRESLARKQTISQFTKSSGRGNKTLVLVPLKVTSNGEPEAGTPGAKDGSVGHGGPQFPYTPLRSPVSTTRKPAVTLAAIHRPRCIRTGDSACMFCCWFILVWRVSYMRFLRAERSDDSAFNVEYRPNRTHRVTTGLDPVVHDDIRRMRRHKETERAGSPHGLPDQARQ